MSEPSRLLNVWLVLMVSIAVVAGIAVLRRDSRIATAPTWYWQMKLEWSNQANTVLAGDSRVYRGLAPDAFTQTLGGKCVNFGFSGVAFDDKYLDAIEKVIRTNGDHPPVVVLGISAWSLTPRAAAANGFLEARAAYRQSLLPISWRARADVVMHSVGKIDLEEQIGTSSRRAREDNYLQSYRLDGWVASDYRKRDPARGLEVVKSDHAGNPFEPDRLDRLARRIRAWRGKGWHVFALVMPAMPEADALSNELSGFNPAAAEAILARAGARWIHLDRVYESYDGTHLTANSAQRLSSEVALEIARSLAEKAVGDYRWREIPQLTRFPAADSSPNAVVSHRNQTWLLSGWSYKGGVWASHSAVWVSNDLANWQVVNGSPPYDPYSAFVVFQDAIWAVGPNVYRSVDGKAWDLVAGGTAIPVASRVTVHGGALWVAGGSSVWKSEDGLHWTTVTKAPPWGNRQWPGWLSFQGALWIIGGSENYGKPNEKYHNDVWRTADGQHWEQVLSKGPWSSRYWSGVTSFDGRIWLVAGWRPDLREDAASDYGNLNEVWSSVDGRRWEPLRIESPWRPRHAAYLWEREGSLHLAGGYGGGGDSRLYNDVWSLAKVDDDIRSILTAR